MFKTKLAIVKIDESEYCNEDIIKKYGKNYGIYIVNLNEITHCCEITGSYALEHIGETYELPQSFEEYSREEQNKIEELENDINYEITYVSEHTKFNFLWQDELKEFETEGKKEEYIEEKIAYYQGNPCW